MALTKKQTANAFDMYNKDIKTTRYLLQKMEPRSPLDIVECGDKWLEMRGAIIKKEVELTEEELYELSKSFYNYQGFYGESGKVEELEEKRFMKAQDKIRKVLNNEK